MNVADRTSRLRLEFRVQNAVARPTEELDRKPSVPEEIQEMAHPEVIQFFGPAAINEPCAVNILVRNSQP